MNREFLMQLANSDPRFERAINAIESQLARMPIAPEDIDELIQALEYVLQNPSEYRKVVTAAINQGLIEPGMVPEQYDQTFVISVLVALYGVQERMASGQGFKQGGLASAARQVAAAGRGGDSVLAHINPREAEILRRMGGSGSVNPTTGLREYKGGKEILRTVVPIALSIVAPGLGTAIGTALGASGAAASMIGGAILGGATSALTGGNALQGALLGAFGGGFGDTAGSFVGEGVKNLTGISLAPALANTAANTLIGGGVGALTGQGFKKGALGALTGSVLGQSVGSLAGQAGGTALGTGLSTAGKSIGYMTAAGVPLKQAVTGSALVGALSGFSQGMKSPTDKAATVAKDIDSQIQRVDRLLADPTVPEAAKEAYSDYLNQLQLSKSTLGGYQETLANAPKTTVEYERVSDLLNKPGTGAYSGSNATQGIYQDLGIAPPPEAGLGASKVGVNIPTAAVALSLATPFALDSLAKLQTPQEIQDKIRSSNPEYFENLRLTSWDWNDISRKAAEANVPLGLYVATNWNNLTQADKYTSPGSTTTAGSTPPPRAARGGPLSRVAYLAKGSGSGRADTIDARLSDGEYVMDAETVAMLGDGSTRAGALKLDQMRQQLRQHKGKALSRGKFSPNAKSPLAYIKGAA